MLQHKDTANIQEIKTLFQVSWIKPEFFKEQLDLFKFSKFTKIFMSVKKAGVPFWDIMKLLLVLPFTNVKSIHSIFTNKAVTIYIGQKDIFYRSLGNQKINWRNLLLLFVKRYLNLEDKFTKPNDNVKCLAFDDTEIHKTGKTIEGGGRKFTVTLRSDLCLDINYC